MRRPWHTLGRVCGLAGARLGKVSLQLGGGLVKNLCGGHRLDHRLNPRKLASTRFDSWAQEPELLAFYAETPHSQA